MQVGEYLRHGAHDVCNEGAQKGNLREGRHHDGRDVSQHAHALLVAPFATPEEGPREGVIRAEEEGQGKRKGQKGPQVLDVRLAYVQHL